VFSPQILGQTDRRRRQGHLLLASA